MGFQLKAGTFSNSSYFLLAAFILSALCSTETLADNVINDDVVGIYSLDSYVYDYDGNKYAITHYITIHRNGDQYIVINISDDANFLRALGFIGFAEAFLWPIEKMAITFSRPSVEITSSVYWYEFKRYPVETIIPLYPNATLSYGSHIYFNEKDDFIYACVFALIDELLPPRCYKKIF